MRYWTEDAIKEVLDGTWTRVLHDGRVITQNIEADFTVDPKKGGRPKGYEADRPMVHWSPAEDHVLWQMRLRNRKFDEIAWVLNRSLDATKKRYRVLRVKGAVAV